MATNTPENTTFTSVKGTLSLEHKNTVLCHHEQNCIHSYIVRNDVNVYKLTHFHSFNDQFQVKCQHYAHCTERV